MRPVRLCWPEFWWRARAHRVPGQVGWPRQSSLSSLIDGLPARRGQFEPIKRKAGRDGTAGQRPVSKAFGGLPRARRYRHLWHLACMNVGAKSENFFLGSVDDLEPECRASVIVPDLHRVDAMPVRSLAACKQEQDRGRCWPPIQLTRVAKGFAIVSAFRMRLELERADHVLRGWIRHGR